MNDFPASWIIRLNVRDDQNQAYQGGAPKGDLVGRSLGWADSRARLACGKLISAPLYAFLALAAASGFVTPSAAADTLPQSQSVLVPGLLFSPVYLATDSFGDVYVSATGNGSVSEIRARTGERSTILWGLNAVQGLAIDHDGDIFLAAGNQVDEVLHGTSTPVPLAFQGLQDAVAVAVDRHGDVFVADFFGNKVEELTAGSPTPITLQVPITLPTGVATDAAGDLFVFGYAGQVAEIAAGSTTSQVLPITFGTGGAGTVDRDGNVFATDPFHQTVTEYAAGTWTPTVLPFGNELSFPETVAVDAKDDVFVPNGLNDPLELKPGSATPIELGSPALSIGPVAADSGGDVFFVAQEFVEASGTETSTSLIEEISPHHGRYAGVGTGQAAPLVRYTGAATGLAADRYGNLYFVTGGPGVQVLAPGATTPTTLFASTISGATSVAVDNAGDIFVLVGSFDSQVEEIKAGTTDVLTLPIGPLIGATGIAVDGAGDVFVTQNAATYQPALLLELPAGSQSVTTVTFPGPGDLFAVASDAAGDIVVARGATSQIGFLAHGSMTPTVLPFTGLGGPSLGGPNGVAVDGQGDVFETDGGLGLSELTGPLPGTA